MLCWWVQGTLSQLDTKNPVMYLDFPAGRLKLLGTLVFPKSKYVVMRNGVGHVLCEDVFETMVRRGRASRPALQSTRLTDPS